MLASRCLRSISSKRAKFSASRRNSCTVDIPVMFSCRNALIRAIQPRTTRYDSRTLRPEPLRDERDERQHGEGHQRQPPVHPQHHAHDADEREDVAEDRDDAGREQIVQHVHVRGDARHQPADRIAIVVAEVEPLQMAVDRHPQVEHDPLPGQLHRPGLRRTRRRTPARARRGRATASRPSPSSWRVAMCSIDGDLHQVGLRERHRGAQRDRDERDGHLRASTGAGRRAAGASAARRTPCRGSRRRACTHDAASSSSSSCFRCSSAYSAVRAGSARRACRARRCAPGRGRGSGRRRGRSRCGATR